MGDIREYREENDAYLLAEGAKATKGIEALKNAVAAQAEIVVQAKARLDVLKEALQIVQQSPQPQHIAVTGFGRGGPCG